MIGHGWVIKSHIMPLTVITYPYPISKQTLSVQAVHGRYSSRIFYGLCADIWPQLSWLAIPSDRIRYQSSRNQSSSINCFGKSAFTPCMGYHHHRTSFSVLHWKSRQTLIFYWYANQLQNNFVYVTMAQLSWNVKNLIAVHVAQFWQESKRIYMKIKFWVKPCDWNGALHWVGILPFSISTNDFTINLW